MNRTAKMCTAYKSGTPVKLIAEQFGVQSQAVWKALRRGGVLPPYQPKQEGKGGRPIGGGKPGYTAARLARSVAAISRREAASPIPPPVVRINREPCFLCGTRGDIGCKHQVVA